MSRLTELKKLLAGVGTAKTGTVTDIRVASIVVKSPAGTKEFTVANPGTFKIGDKVRFQGDLLVGKLPSEVDLPLYSV